jgi:hypothetical protein
MALDATFRATDAFLRRHTGARRARRGDRAREAELVPTPATQREDDGGSFWLDEEHHALLAAELGVLAMPLPPVLETQ